MPQTTRLRNNHSYLFTRHNALCSGLAATVNSALSLLYWRIGQRIRTEVLKGERAGYGEQIVSTLARQLEAEHGRGFSSKNLRHMLRFAEVFEAGEIVYALSRQLSWTHLGLYRMVPVAE